MVHEGLARKTPVELNDLLENLISPKIVRRELHKSGFHEGGRNKKPTNF